MNSKLMEKMLSANKTIGASILSDSDIFNNVDFVTTNLPILNAAFSGEVDGGLVSGVNVFSGESGTFKSLLGLYCMRAYLDKYPDSIAIWWDSERGITKEYLASNGIDINRVAYIPIEHLEQLKFDMIKRIEQISKGDKVFLFLDSLGGLGSKKELEDALDEKSTTDMTRAKVIRSILRLATPMINGRDIPLVLINHVYKNITAMYGGNIQGGGTAVSYFSNQVFEISRSQEKDGDELVGLNFTINIVKSRFVRLKSKFTFLVNFEDGIDNWSGIFDLALEGKFITSSKKGWYSIVDVDTGEVSEKNMRKSDMHCEEILGKILKNDKFKKYVSDRFKLSYREKLEEDDIFTEEVVE